MNFLQNFDTAIFWTINSHHSPFFDGFFFVTTNFGNAWIIVPLLILLAIKKIPRKRLALALALFLGGMLVSGLTNTTIKAMVHRPRPLAYFAKHPAMINGVPHDAACVHVVGKAWKTRSFPSGHAETAFSAATIASILFGGWYWLSYLIALLVAYSRVYSGVHFPLDTLGGAVLGVIVTGAFMLWYRRGG